jgi:HD-GYP domain-containing protein (c-di-GMP phosphodiesterase class II)
MKQHPENSAKIIEVFEEFTEIAKVCRHHHERYDGRGYPHNLKKEDIPLHSRIILIADTFDAMTSSRPYRKALSYQIAFEELEEFSGTQFDPTLVKHFIKAMEKEQKNKDSTFFLRIIDQRVEKKAA